MSVQTISIWALWTSLICVSVLGILAIVLVARETALGRDRHADFSNIRAWLVTLLKRGYHGATHSYTDMSGKHWVRFLKEIPEKGIIRLYLTFPDNDWSAAQIAQLKTCCDRNGLPYPLRRWDPQSETTCLAIRCGGDIDGAIEVLHEVWARLFGLADCTSHKRSVGDVSALDEFIDTPNHPRLPRKALRKRWMKELFLRMNNRLRAARLSMFQLRGNLSMLVLVLFIVCAVLGAFVLPLGLALSTLWSMGEPNTWQFNIGNISVGGSVASAVWLLVYLTWLLVIFPRVCRLSGGSYTKPKLPIWKFVRKPLAFLGYFGLPVAVLMAWAGI